METITLNELNAWCQRLQARGNDALLQWVIDHALIGNAKASWKLGKAELDAKRFELNQGDL